MPFTLDIIVRTCDHTNVHTHEERYVRVSKGELIAKCVASLVQSANMSSDDIKIIVLDDHSTEQTIASLHTILNTSKHPWEIRQLDGTGFNYTAVEQYRAARSARDHVYIIEDDYLHFPTAIIEMIEEYQYFSTQMNTVVALYPFDMPDNYIAPWVNTPCHIVLGHHRHWRTNLWTTNCFFTHKSVIEKFWDTFYLLASEYKTDFGVANNIHEGTTISNIWKHHVPVLTPIPSIALHMQFEQQRDPFIDWEKLWHSIKL